MTQGNAGDLTYPAATKAQMRTIGDLLAKHCEVCPWPEGSVKAQLWAARRAAFAPAKGMRSREAVARETAAVSRRAAAGLGRGRTVLGNRGEWSAEETDLLRRALAEEVQLSQLTPLLIQRSVQAIHLKANRLKREAAAS